MIEIIKQLKNPLAGRILICKSAVTILNSNWIRSCRWNYEDFWLKIFY